MRDAFRRASRPLFHHPDTDTADPLALAALTRFRHRMKLSAAPVPPLTFRRMHADSDAASSTRWLGGRRVGSGPDAIHSPLLSPAGDRLDAWGVDSVPQAHRHGCVDYVTDGQWLHGRAVIDEHDIGMRAASQRIYADIFTVLASQPCSHLLRVWNYFADINGMVDGSERYRQFNAGRQQAFIDVQRSAFEGSPAACALGTHGGPLQVFFLAGRHAPLAIENPRQVSAYRYPDTYGPRAPTFSRAALAELGGNTALFISGTASIVGHASMHVGDVRRQTEESLVNVAAVRSAAEQRSGLAFPAGEMIHTVYVRRAEDFAAVREIFERSVGADSPAAREAIYLQADVCRSELLVEIEAHGFATTTGGTA
jgi:chorismate lyase/3-hydroxybenzoate synthase